MPAKRALSATLALLLAVSFAAPSGARAASADGFNYIVDSGDATVTDCTSICPATLVIPSTLGGYSVTTIGYAAFYSKSLTSVTIPNSVKFIGGNAFNANALTSVTIPNSVTIIDIFAFYNNDLTTVTIGNSVTSIGYAAFANNALTSVTFLGDAPPDVRNVLFGNSGLTSVTRPYTATGWGSTWDGVAVVTTGSPTPTPTATPTPTPTATPTPTPSSTASPTPTPSLTSSPEPSASPDTGGVEPSPTDGDAAPWLIALLLLLASVSVAAIIRRRQRESRRN